jgi:hypothetical protein
METPGLPVRGGREMEDVKGGDESQGGLGTAWPATPEDSSQLEVPTKFLSSSGFKGQIRPGGSGLRDLPKARRSGVPSTRGPTYHVGVRTRGLVLLRHRGAIVAARSRARTSGEAKDLGSGLSSRISGKIAPRSRSSRRMSRSIRNELTPRREAHRTSREAIDEAKSERRPAVGHLPLSSHLRKRHSRLSVSPFLSESWTP